MEGHLLSITIFAPVVGALMIAFMPRGANQAIKWIAAVASLVALAASIVVAKGFQANGGLQFKEIAEVIGVSEVTVRRRWTAARAWLRNEIVA